MAKENIDRAYAYCYACKAVCERPNARDWAHDHVNLNPGHRVRVQLSSWVETKKQ